MGGRPALGAMVLPGMTAAARGALQPTASPAARELLRNRASAETTPPWQPRPSGLAHATPPPPTAAAPHSTPAALAPRPAAVMQAPAAGPGASPTSHAAGFSPGAPSPAGRAADGGAADGGPGSAPTSTPLAVQRPDATATPANTPASAAGPWMVRACAEHVQATCC
jgi:hypothetical protein